ncbi:TadE/TadG family type IV pilus assembly protein [Sphingomonas sp. TDK1]|uniref:TadE/TadG family type IV pilus assembly protein n=1 Tax=Sphingomonas sp. TDK1 TaxID=453247 RepID=UPI0007D905CD|nr:hypothetical protein [Sphingomonas sp. TDK1]OAN62681.1 histidine kinase [Sphingomonas sp. TDK1]
MNMPALFGRLAAARSGAALIEFAIGLPVVLTAGLWAAELTNYAITNQRLSQIALALADNASRVGNFTGTGVTQLREVDINDVLLAAKQQGAPFDLTTNGRIILSSLEASGSTQRIHWQRCIGAMRGADYDSHYGRTVVSSMSNAYDANSAYDPKAGINTLTSGDDSAQHPGSPAPDGMGEINAQVKAPDNSGVMFVEINYRYTPLVGDGWFTRSKVLRSVASFVVRDNRDYTQVYNPITTPPTNRSTCDFYPA